jgi:hypothetical protein
VSALEKDRRPTSASGVDGDPQREGSCSGFPLAAPEEDRSQVVPSRRSEAAGEPELLVRRHWAVHLVKAAANPPVTVFPCGGAPLSSRSAIRRGAAPRPANRAAPLVLPRPRNIRPAAPNLGRKKIRVRLIRAVLAAEHAEFSVIKYRYLCLCLPGRPGYGTLRHVKTALPQEDDRHPRESLPARTASLRVVPCDAGNRSALISTAIS